MSLKVVLLVSVLAVAQSSPIKPYLGFKIPDVISPRIVGGTNAEKGQFPHQVSLQYNNRHFCGGSIISNSWILTAAHCPLAVDGRTFYVKAGKHRLRSVEMNEQVSKVTLVVVHKDYPGNVAPFDISLLKLEHPLEFNDLVQPVSLPQNNSSVDGMVTLSGWGSTHPSGMSSPDVLQVVDLPIVDFATCQRSLQLLIGESPLHKFNICTGPLTGGVSACSGDSGGPLIKMKEDGKPEVVGIVSWGIMPCGTEGAPSVYTKVSSYIDWIENVIRNN